LKIEDQGGDMEDILDMVKRFLVEEDMSFMNMKGRNALGMIIKGRQSTYNVIIEAVQKHEQIICCAQCLFNIPNDKRSSVAEYFTRINYLLKIGNFEMDIEDGEIQFRIGIDAEGGMISRGMFNNMIGISINTFDQYFPGLVLICFSGKGVGDVMKDIDIDRQLPAFYGNAPVC
jgi:hypothetical protein